MKTPILETKRIILRPLTMEDAKTVYDNWTSDVEVAKFMIWDVHTSINDTVEWLKAEQENLNSENQYGWGFVLKETGELFGSGGIQRKETEKPFELGYNIMKKYWGQGLTTEAGEAMLKFAKEQLMQTEFSCRHAVDNIGSQKVMTKLGFIFTSDSEYESFSGVKKFKAKIYSLKV